jgi:hypothetical protein
VVANYWKLQYACAKLWSLEVPTRVLVGYLLEDLTRLEAKNSPPWAEEQQRHG